jgi:methyl-accepting chemotaxis protein
MSAFTGARVSIRTKLLGSSAILLAMSGVIVLFGVISLQGISDQTTAVRTQNVAPLATAADLDHQIVDVRRLLDKGVARIGIAADETAVDTGLAADYKAISADLASIGAESLSADEQALMTDLKTNLDTWAPLRDQARTASLAGNAGAAIALQNQASTVAGNASTDAVKFEQIQVQQTTDAAAAVGNSATTARMILLGILLFAVLIGLFVALYLARSITGGVKAVQATLTSMADNCATYLENGLAAFAGSDLTVEVHAVSHRIEKYGSDEIGETAAVTNKMLGQLQATIDSYETARHELTQTVGEVKSAADAVARTSAEVSDAATQSGNAATQIATTINQVASGASEQARASSETSNAVVELTAIISQVGAGASSITA